MNNLPLLRTKLITPEIPSEALLSDRIKALRISAHRAVIITAPAGYGKTTAVLLSLQKSRKNIHWYRMEKEDAFLSIFYGNLIATLFGEDGKRSDAYRSFASIGNISEEFPLLNAVICQEAWSRCSSGADRYLVFDDFQNAAGNETISETIRYCISNMPPCIHIIVMSREDTGIRTEKLAMTDDLLLLEGKHLLFSKEETEMLFAGSGNTEVSPEYIRDAFAYTEGWIAGITLLLQRPAHLSENGKPFGDADKQNVFRYLLGEALTGAGRERTLAIARISVFSSFTCEDLSAVLHMENPEVTIKWLESHNLYIQKIGTARPSYRFHSLFRNALQSILNDTLSEEEISRIHLSAASHFLSTGRDRDAIWHYLSAGEVRKAVHVAAIEGQKCMDAGNIDGALELIKPLPEQIIFENATLLMIYGASLLNTETDRSFACLEKALVMAVKNREIILATKTEGMLISVCAQRSDFKSIKRIVSQVPMFQSMRSSKHARNMLLMSLFTKSVVTDKVKMSKRLCGFVDRIDSCEDLWNYSNNMTKATLYATNGDFHEAEKVILQIVNHPIAAMNDRWCSLGLSIGANLSLLMHNMDLSQKLTERLALIGEKYASGYARGGATYYAGLWHYQNRDLESAMQSVEKAEKIFTENQNYTMAAFARIFRLAWMAEEEENGAHAKQADEELQRVESLSAYHGLLELAQTMSGVEHSKSGEYRTAEERMKKAYRNAKGKQALQSMCGITMHLAKLYFDMGDYRKEEACLKYFGRTAERNGYVYFREMSYPVLVRTCARCVEKGISTTHMAKIVHVYFGPSAAEPLLKEPSRIAADPKVFISEHPKSALCTERNIKAKLFGAFRLSIDGNELDTEVWKTRKISGILKYILANPNKVISREILAAAFWPESDVKAAGASLRVALFELRKTLAAFDMAFDSDKALVSEGKGGFYVCRPKSIQFDIEIFSSLYEQSKKKELAADEKKSMFSQMVSLYDGDFLEGDVDDEWAIVSREHYKSIYIEVSYKLAEFYRDAGEAERAEALLLKHMKIDPYDENACKMLIELYAVSGRGAQAASLRRQFEKRFKEEMGVKPELG